MKREERKLTGSKQTQAWSSEFGVEYTNRNLMSVGAMDMMYEAQYGISRSNMNEEFLGRLDRNMMVMEVGANVGLQLQFLQRMGFVNLYGIDVSPYAVELSKKRVKRINVIQGSALDIPFKDGYFDMVFTSGVLIHINPKEINIALWEIYRCSRRYIWGFEYFSPEYRQVEYRTAKETDELLWAADFPKLFMDGCDNIKYVKTFYYNYMGDKTKKAVMYLLEKGTQ